MRYRGLAALLLATAIVTTACSGGTGASPQTTTAAAGGGPVVEQAKANVQKAMTAGKSDIELTPFAPPTGKRLGDVSILMAAPGPAAIDTGVKEAGQALGWEVTVLDGKQSPVGYADADRLLVQQRVDGIIHNVVADSATPASLAAAVDAGIPVVCAYCANALNPPTDKPSTASVDPDFKGQGAMLADWIIADSNGTAKVAIQNNNGVSAIRARYDGFMARIKECTGCQVVDDQKVSPGADIIGNGRRTATALLQKFPKGQVGYLVTASDSEAVGPGQIINSTGRTDVKLASYDCDDLNADWIRNGGPEYACVASPLTWGGWAAVDSMARVMAGQKPGDYSVPSQLITKENAPPAGTKPFADVDFRSKYRAAWGK
jgi:ribose transport system substrate-binding protein